jgi:hypothetical protein
LKKNNTYHLKLAALLFTHKQMSSFYVPALLWRKQTTWYCLTQEITLNISRLEASMDELQGVEKNLLKFSIELVD